MIGDKLARAWAVKICGDTPTDPEVVRAIATGISRALWLADQMQEPEHRAGMCRVRGPSGGACKRKAVIGTNRCEKCIASWLDLDLALEEQLPLENAAELEPELAEIDLRDYRVLAEHHDTLIVVRKETA